MGEVSNYGYVKNKTIGKYASEIYIIVSKTCNGARVVGTGTDYLHTRDVIQDRSVTCGNVNGTRKSQGTAIACL